MGRSYCGACALASAAARISYEEANFPGHYKLSKPEWDHEMTRIRNNTPGSMIFQRQGNSGGRAMWRWKKEVALKVVSR